MRNVLKWVGRVFAVLVGLIVLAVVVLNIVARSAINRSYDVEVASVTIPDDEDSLARGEYLANVLCAECHGEDLGGMLMFEEPGIAAVYAPNVTPSETGVAGFTDEDYVRAIRHGVGPDGVGYFIMPAEILIHWSEEDLGATIAYLKTLEPIDNATPDKQFGVMGGVLYGLGMFGQLVAADYVDHDAPLQERPEISANAEYGEYFTRAFACTMCHGLDMMGGAPPPSIPEMGNVPPAFHAGSWTREEFLALVTMGETPDGRQLDPEFMDWELYADFNQVELEAVHAYLQTLQ